MPWVKVTAPFIGTLSKSGVEAGDGWISAVLGAVAGMVALSALSGSERPASRWAIGATSCLAFVLGVFELVDVKSITDDMDSEVALASVGVGLNLLLAGAGLAVFSALFVGTPPEPFMESAADLHI